MLIDKYRNLLSTVAFAPEGDGAPAADAPKPDAGDSPPAGDALKPDTPKLEPTADAKPSDQKPEPKAPKGRSSEDVFQDRIGEITRHRRDAERREAAAVARADKAEADARAAQALLEARGKPEGEGEVKPVPVRPAAPAPAVDDYLNTPEGKRAVADKAAAESRAADISRRGDEIYDFAEKEFGKAKLDKAMGNFKAFDGLRVDLAEAIFSVPESHKVLFEIGSDPDKIDRLYKLAETNPIAMAVEVAKMSNAIAARPAPKKVSDAPEPPEPINGRGNAGPVDLADKDVPMEKWVEARNKDLQKRGVRL